MQNALPWIHLTRKLWMCYKRTFWNRLPLKLKLKMKISKMSNIKSFTKDRIYVNFPFYIKTKQQPLKQKQFWPIYLGTIIRYHKNQLRQDIMMCCNNSWFINENELLGKGKAAVVFMVTLFSLSKCNVNQKDTEMKNFIF